MSKILLLILPLVVSCSHLSKKTDERIDIGGGAFLKLNSIKDVLPDIEQVQLLTFEHGEKRQTIQTVLKVKDNQMSIVGLMPLGGEVFRVTYIDGVIVARAPPFMPENFDFKYALADIILIYGGLKNLNVALENAKVQESSNVRKVSTANKDLVHIQFEKTDRSKSKVSYDNKIRNYKIQITPAGGEK